MSCTPLLRNTESAVGSYELHLGAAPGTIEVDSGDETRTFSVDRSVSTAVPNAALFDAALAVPVAATLHGTNASVVVFGAQRRTMFLGAASHAAVSNDAIVVHILHAVMGELAHRHKTGPHGSPPKFEVFCACAAVVDDEACMDLLAPTVEAHSGKIEGIGAKARSALYGGGDIDELGVRGSVVVGYAVG